MSQLISITKTLPGFFGSVPGTGAKDQVYVLLELSFFLPQASAGAHAVGWARVHAVCSLRGLSKGTATTGARTQDRSTGEEEETAAWTKAQAQP